MTLTGQVKSELQRAEAEKLARGTGMEAAMKKWMRLLAGSGVSVMLWTGAALGQDRLAGCDKAAAPENVEGQVVKIDQDKGILTVRGTDGTTFEFHASKEILEEYKVGDSIKARLRSAPDCP